MGYSPQASLSLGFSGQEYWSGLPFPPPRDLPNPGIKPMSPHLCSAGGFFIAESLGKPEVEVKRKTNIRYHLGGL